MHSSKVCCLSLTYYILFFASNDNASGNSSKVVDPDFLWKKKIEISHGLEQLPTTSEAIHGHVLN